MFVAVLPDTAEARSVCENSFPQVIRPAPATSGRIVTTRRVQRNRGMGKVITVAPIAPVKLAPRPRVAASSIPDLADLPIIDELDVEVLELDLILDDRGRRAWRLPPVRVSVLPVVSLPEPATPIVECEQAPEAQPLRWLLRTRPKLPASGSDDASLS